MSSSERLEGICQNKQMSLQKGLKEFGKTNKCRLQKGLKEFGKKKQKCPLAEALKKSGL